MKWRFWQFAKMLPFGNLHSWMTYLLKIVIFYSKLWSTQKGCFYLSHFFIYNLWEKVGTPLPRTFTIPCTSRALATKNRQFWRSLRFGNAKLVLVLIWSSRDSVVLLWVSCVFSDIHDKACVFPKEVPDQSKRNFDTLSDSINRQTICSHTQRLSILARFTQTMIFRRKQIQDICLNTGKKVSHFPTTSMFFTNDFFQKIGHGISFKHF